MTVDEAIKEIKRWTGILMFSGKCDYETAEAQDMAIKALEEVQRWHTSIVNPKIKNVFANTSTQACQNCDHKDEYIEELEAEIAEYRVIGTPEECREAVKKQIARNAIDSNMESGIFRKRKIFTCPRCGNACLEMMMNERQNTNYCWDCGQKLDWSDEE